MYFVLANTCLDEHLSDDHGTVELAGGAPSADTGVTVTVTCTTDGYGLTSEGDRVANIDHDLVCESNGDISGANAIPQCDGKYSSHSAIYQFRCRNSI